jgi:hypothetical protein
MRTLGICLSITALLILGCAKETPLQPARSAAVSSMIAKSVPSWAGARGPGYEPAYVDGKTVMINAIDVPNHAPLAAQADFYEVVYPIGWQQLGLAPPQCNPCDHEGNGIDFTDFHDHILDSAPSIKGSSRFSPLWHVFVIVPAYSGDATHDAAVSSAIAARLPVKSEDAVEDLINARDANGAPLVVSVDTHFYFLCAVVSPNAAK